MSWMHWVSALPLAVTAGVILAVSVAGSWLVVRLVRRVWPYPHLKENNEIVGFTYAVFGLIYGVLLAFTIIAAWERYAHAESIVLHEATVLSELWRDSQAFEPDARDRIHDDLLAYTQSVISDEWPEMAARSRAHPRTAQIYERLWQHTYTLQPADKIQEAYLGEFLARMNELSGARRMRMMYSHSEIHGILWLVLTVGTLPTIAYSLLFANRHAWVQVTITGFITLIVLLSLLVALSLQYPFTGDAAIGAGSFRELLGSFHERLRLAPP